MKTLQPILNPAHPTPKFRISICQWESRPPKIRPIHKVRIWISEGLTQADSEFQGVEFPGPPGFTRYLEPTAVSVRVARVDAPSSQILTSTSRMGRRNPAGNKKSIRVRASCDGLRGGPAKVSSWRRRWQSWATTTSSWSCRRISPALKGGWKGSWRMAHVSPALKGEVDRGMVSFTCQWLACGESFTERSPIGDQKQFGDACPPVVLTLYVWPERSARRSP